MPIHVLLHDSDFHLELQQSCDFIKRLIHSLLRVLHWRGIDSQRNPFSVFHCHIRFLRFSIGTLYLHSSTKIVFRKSSASVSSFLSYLESIPAALCVFFPSGFLRMIVEPEDISTLSPFELQILRGFDLIIRGGRLLLYNAAQSKTAWIIG